MIYEKESIRGLSDAFGHRRTRGVGVEQGIHNNVLEWRM